jgi:hypothetical protein
MPCADSDRPQLLWFDFFPVRQPAWINGAKAIPTNQDTAWSHPGSCLSVVSCSPLKDPDRHTTTIARSFFKEVTPMFNPTQIIIIAFVRELREMYDRSYGTLEPGFPGVIGFVAQLALENIATSNAPYHDVNHTIMVTLVGQEILRGRHIIAGGVSPRDWLHFIISLLCHDIGYVRGICRADDNGRYVSNWREIRSLSRKAPPMRR